MKALFMSGQLLELLLIGFGNYLEVWLTNNEIPDAQKTLASKYQESVGKQSESTTLTSSNLEG